METIVISDKATKVIITLKKAINNSPNGISFVSINNYTNSANEVSNNLLNIGIKYSNQKAKDIEFLKNLNIYEMNFNSSLIDIEKARIQLIESFIKPSENHSKGQIEAYTHITEGLKVHNETGLLYIFGYRLTKTVISEGEYKEVKSSSLTIAKNELRKLLKTSKYKQFQIEVGNTLKANKETLEL
jgi:hypothetical protein